MTEGRGAQGPARSEDQNLARALLDEARRALPRAYAPYSGFRVGAAVMAASGKVYGGVNVENASYGLTVCAERVAVQTAVAAGERELLAVAIATDSPEPVAPCGACRQVLSEFGPDMLVVLAHGQGSQDLALSELLPRQFRPTDLARGRRAGTP